MAVPGQLEENGNGWRMKIGLDCSDEVLYLVDEVASLEVGVGIAFGTNRTKCWPRLTTRSTSAFSINTTGIDDVTIDSPIPPASLKKRSRNCGSYGGERSAAAAKWMEWKENVLFINECGLV